MPNDTAQIEDKNLQTNSQNAPLSDKSHGKLTVSDAAQIVDVSPSTLRRLETEGQIYSTRLENGYRVYDMQSVMALKQKLDTERAKKKVLAENQFKKRHPLQAQTVAVQIPVKTPVPAIQQPQQAIASTVHVGGEHALVPSFVPSFKNVTAMMVIALALYALTNPIYPYVNKMGADLAMSLPEMGLEIGQTTNTYIEKNMAWTSKQLANIQIPNTITTPNLNLATEWENLKNILGAQIQHVTAKFQANKQNTGDVNTANIPSKNILASVLGTSTTPITDYRLNIGTNTAINGLLNVVGLATLTGGIQTNGASADLGTGALTAGTINNVTAINAITETTLETTLDLAGDVTATGLGNTVVTGLGGVTLGAIDASSGSILMGDGDQIISVPSSDIAEVGTLETGTWEADPIDAQYLIGVWKTAGNASTTPGTDFIGTTDLQDLVFKTNALERLRVGSTGNLGVGSSSPTGLLSVGATNGFVVDSSGNITKLNGVTYSFPSAQGSASQVLQNNGSGTLSWGAVVATDVTDDTLDFTEFVDNMTLDTSTDIAVTGSNVLSITNSGAGNSLVVNDVSGDTTPFVIDTNGNVAVGATSTSYKLEVNGTLNAASLYLSGTQVTSTATELNYLDGTTATAGGIIYGTGTYLGNNGTGTSGYVLTSAGTAPPTWTNPASLASATSLQAAYANGNTIDLNASDGDIIIKDALAADVLYLAQSNGRVGIGTQSPSTKLHVNGGVTAGTYNGLTINTTGGTLSISDSKTISFADAFTTLGAYPLTVTTTASTSVTLPVGGTLSTLAGTETLTNKTIAAGSNTITGLTNTNLSGSAGISNANLANSSITINNGTGITGGGTVSLGSSLTLTNVGVTSLTGTTDQVNLTAGTGPITISLPQSIATTSSPTFSSLTLTNPLSYANGGTGQSSYAKGDIVYASAINTLAKRNIGSSGEVLVVDGTGVPVWGTISAASCTNCLKNDPNTTQVLTPTAGTATGLVVSQASGGSVDVFKVANYGNTVSFLAVNSSGDTVFGDTTLDDTIKLQPITAGSNAYGATITTVDLTGAQIYTFPNATGTVCLTTGNCAGQAGVIGGSGATNYVSKFTDQYNIGNSLIYDTGTYVGIGTTAPGSKLEVNGGIVGATFNGMTITSSTGTFTLTNAKTLTVSNTLSFAGTDSTSFTFPSATGIVVTTDATQALSNKTIAAGSNTITGLTNTNLSGTAGITDANISDTLTASIFKGSGTTTDAVDLATAEVAGTLPIGAGGTGSATQNFVDLTTGQTVAGAKVLSNLLTLNGGLTVSTGGLSLTSTSGTANLTLNTSSTAFKINDMFNVDTLNTKVGVGTTAPTSTFSVGSLSEFQVNSTGDIIKIDNVTYNWPSSQGAANTYLKNDGSGTLSWATSGSGGGTCNVSSDCTYVLSPEYPSAIITADGSNNTGTLTSDVENHNTNYFYNYYEFTSNQASLQDYDIYVQWQLPSAFVNWDAGANALQVDYATEDTSTSNNKIEVTVYRQGDADTYAASAVASSPAADWESTVEAQSPIAITRTNLNTIATWAAGDVMILKIKLSSKDNYYARVGAIRIIYDNQ